MIIAKKNKNTNKMEFVGESGSTPSIGANGTWVINGVDTGVRADMGAHIDDTTISNATTWSSQKIDDEVTNALNSNPVNISGNFYSEEGFGNIRFYNGVWEAYDESTSTWNAIITSSNDNYVVNMVPQNMRKMCGRVDTDEGYVALTWEEPANTVIDGQLACPVTGVKIYRKKDSAPNGYGDGELIADIKASEFGKHKTKEYIDNGPFVVGSRYYYHFYPYSGNNVNESARNEISVVYREYELYGFVFDPNESDPFSNITYIEDNVNFTSAKMDYVNDEFNYGDWENAWFIRKCKPCMLKYDGTVDYYLDKNDYAYKEDGTASDITDTSYGGNVMIEFPIIYYKIEANDDPTYNFYFSNKQVDSSYKPWWSFYDANGNVIDHMYMAAYSGSNISSVLRSISGTTNIYSQTGTTEISYANANNTAGGVNNIWDTGLYSDRQLINMLLMLIGKSTDTQTTFGNGNIYYQSVSGDANNVSYNLLKSGTMNSKGLFWGSNSITSHIGVKVFGIENYWGNQWQRIRGLINSSGTQKIKLTYGQIDGSTVDGYNTDGTGYISVAGATPSGTSGGYTSKCIIGEYGIIPYQASGSATTYECDGLYYNNSQVAYAYVGGGCGSTLFCGAFAVNLNGAVSHSNWPVGASISCKPLAL